MVLHGARRKNILILAPPIQTKNLANSEQRVVLPEASLKMIGDLSFRGMMPRDEATFGSRTFEAEPESIKA
jgi:hypothetical protein